MTKQEFMAMSLPYGLKAKNRNEKGHIHNVDHYMYQYICDSEKDKDLYKYDLILHPLSDLTKDIEHKGENFVPIVELAKLVKSKLLPANPEYIIDECYAPNCVRYSDHYIWFNGDSVLHSILTEAKEHKLIVYNQIELLLMLTEWHFDISGLIEKGEAIDINTLEENPYKWKQI